MAERKGDAVLAGPWRLVTREGKGHHDAPIDGQSSPPPNERAEPLRQGKSTHGTEKAQSSPTGSRYTELRRKQSHQDDVDTTTGGGKSTLHKQETKTAGEVAI